MNIAEILENCCWSVICESYSNGDDSSIEWLVVGYYMSKPHQRVLGHAGECGGVESAIKMAIETTKENQYNYLYEYSPLTQ